MRFIFGALYIYEDEKITPANVSAPTKGEPVPPNPLLAKARVAKGFDMMYRRFTQTPGNTLSMQASITQPYSCMHACMQASKQDCYICHPPGLASIAVGSDACHRTFRQMQTAGVAV